LGAVGIHILPSLKCTFALRRPPPSLPFQKQKGKSTKSPNRFTEQENSNAATCSCPLSWSDITAFWFSLLLCPLAPGHDVHFQFIHFHIIHSPPPFIFLSFLRPLSLLLLLLLSFLLFLHAPLLLLCRPFTFRAPTLPLTLTPVRRRGGGGRGGGGGGGGGR